MLWNYESAQTPGRPSVWPGPGVTVRILHVVCFTSDDGRYGGPLRVAVNQARELDRRGHEATLLSAWGDSGKPPQEFAGVPAVLRPARRLLGRSYAFTFSIPLYVWAWRNVRRKSIVHIHLSRDLVTLPIAWICLALHVPFVLQTHGMLATRSRILDAATRLLVGPILRSAERVLCLTEGESRDIARFSPSAKSSILLNGVESAPLGHNQTSLTTTDEPLVLWVGRIHPRKRPQVFLDAASAIQSEFPNAQFEMVGGDDGAGDVVREFIREHSEGIVTWRGALDHDKVVSLMQRATVLACPAIEEPFGLVVLEAMSQSTAVIVTEDCGLSELVRDSRAGLVVSSDEADFAEAIKYYLRNPEGAVQAGRRGYLASQKYGSISGVVDSLIDIYSQCTLLNAKP